MSNPNTTDSGSRKSIPMWTLLVVIPLVLGAFFLGTQQVQKVQYIEQPPEEELSAAGPLADPSNTEAEEEPDPEEAAKPQPRRSDLPEDMVRDALMPQQKTVALKFASLPKVEKLDYYTIQQEKEKVAQAAREAERNQPTETELRAMADQERFSKVKVQQIKAPAEFFDAARGGDLAKLESMLKEGIDINSADATGSTALMIAAFRGHRKTVEALLQKGADRSLKNRFQQTAADMAKEFPDIVKLLTATEK